MPCCDMCGKEGNLVRAMVEGSELYVCNGCGKYGKIVGRTFKRRISLPKRSVIKDEVEEKIVSDYSSKIRIAREGKGLKQEDFAKMLNERASLVNKWESGNLRPRINVARKLERLLGIKLVKKVEVGKVDVSKSKTSEPTLGDFIKVRKRN